MQVISRNPENFTEEYNVILRRLFPANEQCIDSNIPFSSSWVIVEKNKFTDPHRHDLHEVFFITEGEGILNIDGEEKIVTSGDVIYIYPNKEHTIKNKKDNKLIFLTIYWNK
ncbi:cupin domain-containing protein [Bacillus velezensis]|uniref:cupin domain-containing protein n=1 Tax=Bacillus velezensis TaxID=492670 RepID=UPI003D7F4F97